MPWLETVPMDQRARFLADRQHGLYAMTELCTRYGISRKTGYKWLARYAAGGQAALGDRSHAPHHCPHRLADDLTALLCAVRVAHPHWGPAKLLDWLRPRHPDVVWPARSTVGDLLARHGLVTPRRWRRRAIHPGVVPIVTTAPNDLWTIDFKGQFRVGAAGYCYPLTLADQHTRFLLACHGLPSTRGLGARAVLERAFRTYGLPHAIRSDNGSPFATTAIHGLSPLNVWWLRLGIQHQRIQPGCPQQNGAHERMHRTLKAETCRPPRRSFPAQQRAFDAFRDEYNTERPHAALAGEPPAARYQPSPRPYPERLPPFEYPGHFVVRRVTHCGTFSFHGHLIFLSKTLNPHFIGLDETSPGIWSIYLGAVLLARLDERDHRIRS